MIDKSKHEKEFPIQIRNKNGNLIHTENIKGSYLSFEYDHSNRIIGCERSDGFWFKLEYDEKDEIIHFENSNKIWKKFQYNKFGDIKKYEDSYGSNVTFLYDDESRLHCEVGKIEIALNSSDFDRLWLSLKGSNRRNEFCDLSDIFEETESFNVRPRSNQLRHIEFYYNEKGQRIKSVREDGSIEKYEYNSFGNLTSIIGPEGIIKKFNFKYTQDGEFLEYSDEYEKIEVEYLNNICIRKKYENEFAGECVEQKYTNDGLPLSHISTLPNGKKLEIEMNHYVTINNKVYHSCLIERTIINDELLVFEYGQKHDDKGRIIMYDYNSSDRVQTTEVEYDDENEIAIFCSQGMGEDRDHYFQKKFEEIPDLINPEPPKEFQTPFDWDSKYWRNLIFKNDNNEFDYLPIINSIIMFKPELILK